MVPLGIQLLGMVVISFMATVLIIESRLILEVIQVVLI